MFSHITVGSNDLDRSKKFYDAIFGAIGGPEGIMVPTGQVIYMHGGGYFMVTRPIDGNPATVGNGVTVGFTMASPEQADAWHRAGVNNGGTSIEDPPGVRDNPGMKLYLAYLRDPDGNKLCAMHPLNAAA